MSNRSGLRYLPLLVSGLSTLGPFTIDTYLPSFPDMARGLGASALAVQQSLTFYLVPFALMCLWHGAISDAVGRRRVVLVGLAVYTLASLGCALAPSIGWVWVFRAVQGLASGVGLVVGRAVVRDAHEGADAQRVLAWVSVLYLVAPAVAPLVGGWLQARWGWRAVFVFLGVLGALLGLACAVALPETLPPARRRSLRVGDLLRGYRLTLADRPFLAASLAMAFNFSALFLYISSAPVFLMRHLGVDATRFYWLFGPTTAGLVVGGMISGRLAGRISTGRTLVIAHAVMLIAATLNVFWHVYAAPGLPASVVPLLVHAAGIAMAGPSLTLLGMDRFPERRGMAASCQAFLVTGGNSLTAGCLAPWAQASVLRMAAVAWCLMACGMVAALLRARLARRSGVGVDV